MALAINIRSRGCDGFRVESAKGLIGWIEETWLGPANESTALALRMLDGRRGLLVIDDVEAVASERELIVVRSEARVLELDVPRIVAVAGDGRSPARVSASWTTTGELLELPPPPRALQRLLLTLRPWRLASPSVGEVERPLWQLIGLLYASIALLVVLLIAACFLAAYLVAGTPY